MQLGEVGVVIVALDQPGILFVGERAVVRHRLVHIPRPFWWLAPGEYSFQRSQSVCWGVPPPDHISIRVLLRATCGRLPGVAAGAAAAAADGVAAGAVVAAGAAVVAVAALAAGAVVGAGAVVAAAAVVGAAAAGALVGAAAAGADVGLGAGA